MGMDFTPEQKAVIDARNCNLLVSAAAGSGKTAVLVERIIKLITENTPDGGAPIDIDHLLVVTFTRAAAAQMKERITQAIEKRLLTDPANAHLQRQETLIHNAQITTIDSFCQYVIRNNFNDIGLDPSYRVADEGEIRLLEESVMADFLEEKYALEDADFLYTAQYFSNGANDKGLEEQMHRLYRFSMSMPWPEDWLLARSSDYDLTEDNFDSSAWMQQYVADASQQILELSETLQQCVAICEQPDGPYVYAEMITQEQEMLDFASRASDYEAMRMALSAVTFRSLSPKKDDAISPGKRTMVKSMREKVKTEIKGLQESYFIQPREMLIKNSTYSARALNTLCHLTIEFKNALDEKKREQNIIDFTDMEHFALEILVQHDPETGKDTPSESAQEYRAFYKEILIDEYQDSNSVQELILSAIGGQDKDSFDRFMVGDVKQSIYKFRLARPEIFMEKLDTYDKSGQVPLRRIDLHKNFRSRHQVLNGVNYVFRRIMGQDLGGVRYDEDAMLQAGALYPEHADEPDAASLHKTEGSEKPLLGETITQQTDPYATELLLIQTDDEGGDADSASGNEANDWASGSSSEGNAAGEWGLEEAPITPNTKLSSRQQEAMVVAGRIRELLQSGEISDGKGGFRKVQRRDIVILLRATTGWDDTFRKILESEGIPAYVESKTGYFGAVEVATLLDLLRILDNPLQDIPLVAVMHSCLGHFSNEELAGIKAYVKRQVREEEKNQKAAEENTEKNTENNPEKESAAAEEMLQEDAEEPEHFEKFYDLLLYLEKMDAYKDDTNQEDTDGIRIVKENEGELSPEFLSRKVHAFLEWFRGLRKRTVYMPVHELLEYILVSTRYRDYVTAMPGGARRRANVDMLLERAGAFEKTSFKGLFHFVRYIEELQKYEVDYGEANVLDENADVVRIMSIHKSKGLEFPVVFVAGMAKRFNKRDATAPLLMDEDMGFGLNAVDLELRVQSTTPRRSMIADKMKRDSLGEELRVLYVAMTRAKEKLIMTGTVGKLEKKITESLQLMYSKGPSSQPELLPLSARRGINSYLELMLMALIAHPAMQAAAEAAGADVSLVDYKKRIQNAEKKQTDPASMEALLAVIPPYEIKVIPSAMIHSQILTQHVDAAIRRQKLTEPLLQTDTETSLLEELAGNFAYVYPHKNYENLYTKTTVTELKKAAYTETMEGTRNLFLPKDEEAYVPAFINAKESLLGAERGTAYHRVMELLDDEILLADTVETVNLTAFMKRKEAEGFLKEGSADSIDAADIVAFLESSVGMRFRAAYRKGDLFREKQFMMGIPDTEVDASLPEGEIVLIQGVIDAFFYEGDEVVLLDYKTDHVKTGEALAERYKVQLDYYERALERLTHKKVKARFLYSFTLGKEVAV